MGPLTIKLLSVRRSLPLFLAIIVCLAIWQVWLTWRLMEQDRNLAAQQSRQRLEQISDLAMAQLTGTLSTWDLRVRELDALPPPAAVANKLPVNGTLILLTSRSLAVYPNKTLLFVPEAPVGEPLPDLFEATEKLEFRDENYAQALESLRPLVQQPAIRPEAWLRIARLERKLNHPDRALAAYDRLSVETASTPDGLPYALLAAGARCEYSPSGNAAERLRTALMEGKWQLRRETFEYYWGEVNRLKHTSGDPPKESFELSALVSQLYGQWQQAVRSDASLNGREAELDGSLLIWHATPERLVALWAPSHWLTAALKLPANAGDIRWKWLAPGVVHDADPGIVRTLAEAQLSGKLEFNSSSGVPSRRLNHTLWLTGVGLTLALMLAGAYAIYRGINRELRVAQLQSDFVSAVSHEFRSPLTSLRSITELLVNKRLPDESRLRQSYVFLERETGRLQRLVEDLLDFGRMESGRKQYSMEPRDAFRVVRSAVADLQDAALADGFQMEVSLDPKEATVRADEEALGCAIRNLLENALKYSPECHTVWVDGRVTQRQVMISVRDRGMGIDPREQQEIFKKFVRGTAAKKAEIKGTGIGLSMVRQIVQACGGEIRVESQAGAGSTFTIVLPLVSPQESRA